MIFCRLTHFWGNGTENGTAKLKTDTKTKTQKIFFGKTDTKTKTQKIFFGKTDTKRKTQKTFMGIRIRKRIRYIRVFQNPASAYRASALSGGNPRTP